VVRAAKPARKGAPVVHDIAPDNTCYVWGLGDKAAVDKAFAGAAHVTTLEFLNNRLIPNAIEPRRSSNICTRALRRSSASAASKSSRAAEDDLGKIRRVQLRRLERDDDRTDPLRGREFREEDFPELPKTRSET